MRCKLLILPCFILFIACNHREKATSKVSGTPANTASAIVEAAPFKEFNALWEYYVKYIKLNEDFVGYDKDHKQISKENFLKILSTGKYQPILINPADSIRYQLKTSPPGVQSSIATYMKTFANKELVFYHMEGKPVPAFNFVTIAGDKYTNENTKGKIVLFKCWFITCHACVQEMPELNAMVKSYRDRKDIVFLSLAMDDKAPLKHFLKATRFDYQTVAGQKNYMFNKLKVNAFPTHFLIDKAGQVVKVSNSAEEAEMFLKRMLAKK
jgi:peroxiredoxin